MVIFFREALNDWILISSIYNAMYAEGGRNANVAIINNNQIRTIDNRIPIVGINENVIIIAHGYEWGDISDDMDLFYGLLVSILPTGYQGTINFRSCWAGRNSHKLRNVYNVYESLVKRSFDLLHARFRNVKVKGLKGPNIDYWNKDMNQWSEICVNPMKVEEAKAIQKRLLYNRFANTAIQPRTLNNLFDLSKDVADETRGFFIEFAEKLKEQKILLTGNIYNYWSSRVEGAQ